MKTLYLLIILSTQAFGAYSYSKSITIDHTKVPNTDQTNFPVLVSRIDTDLKVAGSGGHVINSSGFDIAFFSDAGLTTALSCEQERYVSTTGEVIYWVKVPTVSHTADTVIYVGYGDSGISTSQCTASAVWDSNFKAVWHMKDNAASTTILDSTSNAANGTNTANTSGKNTSGLVGDALEYLHSTSDYSFVTNPINISNTPTTLSFWYYYGGYTSDNGIAGFGSTPIEGNPGAFIVEGSGGQLLFYTSGYSGPVTTMTESNWYYITLTLDFVGASEKLYYNATLGATRTSGYSGNQTNLYLNVGYPDYGSGRFDEVRLSNVLRSADWIATDYNNQSSPSTFLTVGAETSIGGGGGVVVPIRVISGHNVTCQPCTDLVIPGSTLTASYAKPTLTYTIDAMDQGIYQVDLTFVEWVYSTRGHRPMSVKINDVPMLTRFDIIANTVPLVPVTRSMLIPVTDGKLTVALTNDFGLHAILSGIAVTPVGTY